MKQVFILPVALALLSSPLAVAAQEAVPLITDDGSTSPRPGITETTAPTPTTPRAPASNNTNSQTTQQPTKMATLPNPLGDKITDIPSLFYKVINFVISLSYVVVAAFLIWSGFKFVMAAGNEDKISDAKHTFYYTIIGALIVIGANTIVKIFEGLIKSLGM